MSEAAIKPISVNLALPLTRYNAINFIVVILTEEEFLFSFVAPIIRVQGNDEVVLVVGVVVVVVGELIVVTKKLYLLLLLCQLTG